MLACHASQREWLRKHHGMDQYLQTMRDWSSARGRQHGVAFAIGSMFHTDGSGAYFARINFAAQPVDQIEEGMRRLGQAWYTLARNQPVRNAPIF